MTDVVNIGTEFIQYGFAGFALLLLGVLCWVVRRVLELQAETTRVIERNTDSTRDVLQMIERQNVTLADIRDRLLQMR